MAKWIGKAVKHPGRLTKAAAASGVSKLQKAEEWSHSSDPSKRAAGNLGKRFIKGKLHSGGTVPEDGLYEMEEGEKVIPAPKTGSCANMTTEDGAKVPTSTECVLAPMRETVSSTPNKGCVCPAQPVVDAGHDSGVGYWQGDGQDLKFVRGGNGLQSPDLSNRNWNQTDAPAKNKQAK